MMMNERGSVRRRLQARLFTRSIRSRNQCCACYASASAPAPVRRAGDEEKGDGVSVQKTRVAILGASGYTGAEVMRLVGGAASEHFSVEAATAETHAGKLLVEVFPQLRTSASATGTRLCTINEVDWSSIDCCFCCLPHGTTQTIVSERVPRDVKTVDLSADFRLRDVAQYAEWYGGEHRAPDLQREVVYGLSELHRDEVASARVVANPGCYPTCSQLPLVPLIRAGLVSPHDITIDAKSGVSGAGRSVKQGLLFTELADGMQAYGVTRHRHAPEIEQGLSDAAGEPVLVSFTPHLIPMSRGMQCTTYVKLSPTAEIADLRDALVAQYAHEQFVHVLPEGEVPQTRHVRASNHCLMSVFPDRIPGRAILVSVIDNLVKGASGQALQNLNIMCGAAESRGIEAMPVFP